MKSNFTFREFRTRTIMQSIIPIFIDTKTTKIPNYLHHVSMYAISEEDAQIQMRIGNTKNREVVHYTSEAVIDTDNQETAEKVWNCLCEGDYNFELYKLNNYKFILKRDDNDEPSSIMCYQDKQYIKDLLSHCNVDRKLDDSIYNSPFHLIRARGSIHEVTGAKTELVDFHRGSKFLSTNSVVLRKYEKPLNYNSTVDLDMSDWNRFKFLIDMYLKPKLNNHMTIWQFARDICKICSYETASELILIYAKYLNYDEVKAMRAFKQGYESL